MPPAVRERLGDQSDEGVELGHGDVPHEGMGNIERLELLDGCLRQGGADGTPRAAVESHVTK